MMILQMWLDFEFRFRIFISLGIVLLACVLSYGALQDPRTLSEFLGGASARTVGFLAAAALCLFASLLRMSAGTALRSARVMSFDVRPEMLIVRPPYNLVRNPIYLADLVAAFGFTLCMPVAGLTYPCLLLIHYTMLLSTEEQHLLREHGDTYASYASSVPRLLPSAHSMMNFLRSFRSCRIDRDGFRFNALYLLFVPGLCISALTGSFFYAVLIGLPGVADWAYWHTIKGLGRTEDHHERS